VRVESLPTTFIVSPFNNTNTERDPTNLKLIVCGDFNGGQDCGAVQYLEKGSIGPDFLEDGDAVSSKEKLLPLSSPMIDAVAADGLVDRTPPATLVVSELISLMVDDGKVETCYINPHFSTVVLERLHRIYNNLASVSGEGSAKQMGKADVERWLTIINGKVGRGTEFRNAAKFMGWAPPTELEESGDESRNTSNKSDKKEERPPIVIPDDGILTLDDFVAVYLSELREGKFWGSEYKD
jgi:hypothetical protein